MTHLKQVIVAMVSAVALLMSIQALAVNQAEKDAIAERIKPVGTVCMQGEACAATAAAASGPRSGEAVYNASCMACHSTGAAGAPKLGDKAAWAARIKQGMDTLNTHALDGIRGMPARGTCASCSDDEIKAAVEYMVAGSK
ncbi:MAG TPA: cytochrome c5 family protein [Pseudomonadales bacterium]|jgi:cytochrome c5